MKANKIGYICFKQKGTIFTQHGRPLKLVNQFIYFSSNISSTESNVNRHQAKLWNAIDRLSMIWKSDRIKWDFFKAVVKSLLLYRCTTWLLTKCIEKKLNENYTRMLHAVFNKSWKQHSTKQQLYSHLLLISQTIQLKWTRHAVHGWTSKNKLIRDILLWTPTHGHANVGWQAKIYIHHLCADTRCSSEDMPGATDIRGG